MSRYEGKPFLRLLECYVLSSIGQLDQAQQDNLRRMEPNLAAVYHTKGSWYEIVQEQMGFPDTLPAKINELWNTHKAKAEAMDMSIDPNDFVTKFVDFNFPDI